MKPYRNKALGKNVLPKSKLVIIKKDPVEVFCRIRPLSSNSNNVVCLRAQSEKVLQLLPPEIFQKNKDSLVCEYTFSYVFGESSAQDELFEKVALPLVDDLVNGKNALLFTYGVTSSGKTYTMSGNPSETGILPRCFDVVFNSINSQQATKFVFKTNKQNGFQVQTIAETMIELQRDLFNKNPKVPRKRNQLEWDARILDTHKVGNLDPNCVYAVFISYVEIYNNYIYDLLETGSFEVDKGKGPQSRMLREDYQRNMFVYETTEIEVKTAEEAFDAFWRGQQRRKVAHTALNTESSRSHSVFNVRIVRGSWNLLRDDVDPTVPLVISQLSLVDLAGSERTGRTLNTGNRLKEAGNINNSLMVLRQCIEILREKQVNPVGNALKMVPYRENKLTHLFKSFFEGEGRIRMIVCAHPGIDEYEETLQAMKFAEMTQEILIPRQILPPPSAKPKVQRALPQIISPIPLTLGPIFPEAFLSSPEDVESLKMLERFLLDRQTYKSHALQSLNEKQAEFRNNLLQMESDYNMLKQQNHTKQMDLNHRVDQLAVMERKFARAEQTIDSLQRKVAELERSNHSFQNHLREKDQRINAGKVNQLKIQSEMKDKFEMERDRMRRMMQHRLALKEAELQAKMCLSGEKIRMLREILNSGDDWVVNEDAAVFKTPNLPYNSEPQLHLESQYRNIASGSDPKLNANTPRGRAGIPAANPRHRRSASAGTEKWIDHCPVGTVDTGTIFKPIMKRKKSVSKLESKDVIEASKYVLTHQEQEAGSKEMQTQLFKGNVVPSSGGGAQVIFDDVEILNQTSPCHPYSLRKRSSEQALHSNSIDVHLGPAIEKKAPIVPKKPRH